MNNQENTRTEEYYKERIAEEIRRIAEIETNKEAADKFWETLGNIKAKACRVKAGVLAGKHISYTLAFDKGGDKEAYDLFTDSIDDAAFRYGVMFGLNPDIFYYNPDYFIEDETHYYLTFKLRNNG